jgi:uncharacterized phage protein gp47/JayE
MPWVTPTLRQVRELTRDNVSTALSGAAMIANSVLRVMSDAMAALAHLTLRYIDWLALQLLPDTAEKEWLDRHGDIWLVNSDGSLGRKMASFAEGTVEMVGTFGTLIPMGTRFIGPTSIEYESLEAVILDPDPTPIPIRALDGGKAGNLDTGATISLMEPQFGVESAATVLELSGGADEESDNDLRIRVLKRIQEPPMGGCKTDYEHWALAVPGVTRAWCAPNEMGIGTVTVRFMCDQLRWQDNGFPNDDDVRAVTNYMDTVRPVCVKDFWCVAPLGFNVNITITELVNDTPDVRNRITASMLTMLHQRAAPGQTIYASWISEAVSVATGEDHHDLVFDNQEMPTPGHLAVLGSIEYI